MVCLGVQNQYGPCSVSKLQHLAGKTDKTLDDYRGVPYKPRTELDNFYMRAINGKS